MTISLSSVTFTDQDDIVPISNSGIEAITNTGATYTLNGNDHLTGESYYFNPYQGSDPGFFNNYGSIINTGKGIDVITGSSIMGAPYEYGIDNEGSIETGDDGDYLNSYGTFYNYGMVSLGDGNDALYAEFSANPANNYWAMSNHGTIEAGKGDDSFSIHGIFANYGRVSLGDGNDSINLNAYNTYSDGLSNYQTIETEDGDDIIFSASIIYNYGIINTGNGKDSLTASKDFYGSGGSVLLGNDDDHLKGFGEGYYEGGNGQDSLELTSGSYTIGISGAVVSFLKNGYSGTMQTFGFEKLIVGSTTYDFTSLNDEMTIFVP
jgi:hypothetical protein